MRSEETEFSGGPLDGRVMSVLVGPTGRPPKVYTVPVPGAPGEPDSVLVYRLAPAGKPRRTRWRYEYDPGGRPPRGPRWPWSKRTG